ncbi:MAG: YdcF family protein [Chloroflexota bacterium]
MLRRLRAVRWRRIILMLLAAWLVVSLGLAIAVHSYGYQDHATNADVIVVLGAGLNRNSRPTTAQRFRTRRAAELWHAGYAPYIICTGGKPYYATRSEADACKEILMAEGVPEHNILLEDQSRSTKENALYTRDIMEMNGWRTALVVSDRYHLLRANWLFNGVGIVVYTTPTTVAYLRPQQYAYYVAREVAALQWQAFNDFFNLPFTYVPIL